MGIEDSLAKMTNQITTKKVLWSYLEARRTFLESALTFHRTFVWPHHDGQNTLDKMAQARVNIEAAYANFYHTVCNMQKEMNKCDTNDSKIMFNAALVKLRHAESTLLEARGSHRGNRKVIKMDLAEADLRKELQLQLDQLHATAAADIHGVANCSSDHDAENEEVILKIELDIAELVKELDFERRAMQASAAELPADGERLFHEEQQGAAAHPEEVIAQVARKLDVQL